MGCVLTFRTAEPDLASELAVLVRSAYRGESSRAGWTTEADLVDDERVDTASVRAKILGSDSTVLVAVDDAGVTVGCCEVERRAAGVAYFGMFAVRPDRQAGGLGRRLLAEAERVAVARWASARMEMTVIAQRSELIAWYARRGYEQTGERRPFPYGELINGKALRDDLDFVVLAKDLARN
jgi:ribosomal protein S18 acetylase RimI-like enzyme